MIVLRWMRDKNCYLVEGSRDRGCMIVAALVMRWHTAHGGDCRVALPCLGQLAVAIGGYDNCVWLIIQDGEER